MSANGLDVFDKTLQKTNIWLGGIMQELAIDDRQVAYGALRVTLHALRDRLGVDEAAHLAAQLPMLIRGLYYEGWHPAGKPIRTSCEEFLDSLQDQLRTSADLDAEDVARAVFRVLDRHVSPGELKDVKHCLPQALRELWD